MVLCLDFTILVFFSFFLVLAIVRPCSSSCRTHLRRLVGRGEECTSSISGSGFLLASIFSLHFVLLKKKKKKVSLVARLLSVLLIHVCMSRACFFPSCLSVLSSFSFRQRAVPHVSPLQFPCLFLFFFLVASLVFRGSGFLVSPSHYSFIFLASPVFWESCRQFSSLFLSFLHFFSFSLSLFSALRSLASPVSAGV